MPNSVEHYKASSPKSRLRSVWILAIDTIFIDLFIMSIEPAPREAPTRLCSVAQAGSLLARSSPWGHEEGRCQAFSGSQMAHQCRRAVSTASGSRRPGSVTEHPLPRSAPPVARRLAPVREWAIAAFFESSPAVSEPAGHHRSRRLDPGSSRPRARTSNTARAARGWPGPRRGPGCGDPQANGVVDPAGPGPVDAPGTDPLAATRPRPGPARCSGQA